MAKQKDDTFNFTQTRLKSIPPAPKGKRLEYKDETQKGLILRVSDKGHKTFRLRAWNRSIGKTAQMTIGTWPDVKIKDAREFVANKITEMTLGVDVESKEKKKKLEQTLTEAFESWLELVKLEKRTWKEDESRFEQYIKPYLGSMRVSEISSDTILKWRNKLTRKPKQRGTGNLSQSTINRAFAIVSTVYNRMLPDTPNPCSRVKKFKEKSRDVFFKVDELQKLFTALDEDKTEPWLRDFVMLCLFTGQRRSNILSAKWNEFLLDQALWIIPAEKSKNSEPIVIPLVSEVVQILKNRKKANDRQAREIEETNEKARELIKIRPDAKPRFKAELDFNYLFPTNSKAGHLTEPKKAWKDLLDRAGLDSSFRIHDMRRTLGSYQAISGSNMQTIGASLGHKSLDATAIYARLTTGAVKKSVQKAVDAMKAVQK